MIMESGEFWEVCVGMYPELAGDSGFGKLKPSGVRDLVEQAWEEGYAARTRDTKAAQEIMDATLQHALAPQRYIREIETLKRQLADRDAQNKRQAQTISAVDRSNAELESEVDRLTNRLREMCNSEPSNPPRPPLELTGNTYESVEELLKAEGVSDEVMALYLKHKAKDTEPKKHPSTVIPGPIEDYRPWTMGEVLAGTILRWHDGGTAIVTAVRDGGLRVGDADYTFAELLRKEWRQLNGDRCGGRKEEA